MITRREMIKWGVVAPALAGGAHAALARPPQGLDALVLDTRHGALDTMAFAAPVTYPTGGDVTALWYDVLDPLWRKPGFVLGGVTGPDVLFVLETLARDRGRRVVSRSRLPAVAGRQEGPLAWVIAPVHPSVRA